MDENDRLGPENLTRTSSLRSSGSNRTSLVRRSQKRSAKQIWFYRNGDGYFSGLKLAVSSERYKEFNSLLGELSEKINLSTGAVRYVFNSEDNSIVTDTSQLRNGVSYVCSSSNVLRQIEGGYGKQRSSMVKTKEQAKNILGSTENFHQNILRSESVREFIKPKLVTVIRNSKPPQKKVSLLLNSKTAVSLNQVLNQLSAKESLGKVDKLCSVDGRVIKTLQDLFSNENIFIALSANEKFPEEGIELDPRYYRIPPYRDEKKLSNTNVRRANSMRSRKNENVPSSIPRNIQTPTRNFPLSKGVNTNVCRPRSATNRKIARSKDELFPASDCECDHGHSIYGIKKDNRLHSNYRIGRIIGDGNFAIVRECTHRKSNKSYALKIINKAKVKGKEHMIENEISILQKIMHPNIVKLHEEFETTKEIYLVMELVTGGDLFDAIVANTRFSEPDSAFMIRDLASAVKYLHEMNIVHRDIKPENLLVVNRKDGRKSIKLADFGLSVEVNAPLFLVCGTPTYVAPEILDESGYGIKVDVWSIGVICYILLCGFPPFRSTNHDKEELFDKILRADYEYLAPYWDDIDNEPRDLIDCLLIVDAEERYDAEEVLGHFWIKKWVEPVEKIHRQLSEAEDANSRNRKRLRGISLTIQADMRKNQSYISGSLLTQTNETPKIDIDNTDSDRHQSGHNRKLSKSNGNYLTPQCGVSDEEKVQSSDDEECCKHNRSRARPISVSLPYDLDYRLNEYI